MHLGLSRNMYCIHKGIWSIMHKEVRKDKKEVDTVVHSLIGTEGSPYSAEADAWVSRIPCSSLGCPLAGRPNRGRW